MRGLPLDFLLYNLLIDAGFLILPLIILKFIEKKEINLEQFGFKSSKPLKDIILTMEIFGVLLIASFALSIIFSLINLNDFGGVEQIITKVVSLSPFVLVYLFVVRVFVEEYFFRAFLVPRIGVIGSSVLFGIAHLGYGSNGEIIGAFILGIILALFYKYNKKIVPNVIAHMVYNLFVLLMLVGV